MEWSVKSGKYIPPVSCPQCGERQNRFSGRVNPENQIFDKIDCMVCGRVFGTEEYKGLVYDERVEPITHLN
jgi:hypothetical protein